MKYKIGDKILIVSYRTNDMNNDGRMDKYLNKIMTIKENKYGYYLMDKDEDAWWWSDDMIKGLAEESEDDIMSSNGKINKGIDSKMIQDYYRAVVDERGNVKFNHIKMVNVCLVKHDGCPTVYAFENKSDKRLPEGTRVQVMTKYGVREGTVVSSLKIQNKYLKELTYALGGKKHNTLQPILGVYKEVEKTVKTKELVKIGCDD